MIGSRKRLTLDLIGFPVRHSLLHCAYCLLILLAQFSNRFLKRGQLLLLLIFQVTEVSLCSLALSWDLCFSPFPYPDLFGQLSLIGRQLSDNEIAPTLQASDLLALLLDISGTVTLR
jgi:hypothetical protein